MPSAKLSASADGVSRPGSERVLASVHAAAEHTVHAAELPAGSSVGSRSCNIPDTYGLHGASASDTDPGWQGERARQGLPDQRAVPLL